MLDIEAEFLESVGIGYFHNIPDEGYIVDDLIFAQQFIADAYQLAGLQSFNTFL